MPLINEKRKSPIYFKHYFHHSTLQLHSTKKTKGIKIRNLYQNKTLRRLIFQDRIYTYAKILYVLIRKLHK